MTNVACPSGQLLTGVGGEVSGLKGKVVIDDLLPHPTLTQHRTSTGEIRPVADRWLARSYAVCAHPLTGAERATQRSATSSADSRTITARCPAGKQLTGAAGRITGGGGQVVMDDIRPNGGPGVAPTQVTVTAYEIDPWAGEWYLDAYAVCAAPIPGLEVRSVTTTASSTATQTANARCGEGKKLLGLGGEILGGLGEVVMDAYRPGDLLTQAVVIASEASDADGAFAGTWSIRAYAICATA